MRLKRITPFFFALAITVSLCSHSVAQRLAIRAKATLVGHEDQVYVMAFSPGGEFLATVGAREGATRLWNTATGQLIATLDGTTPVFSPDGHVLLTIGKKTVTLWDVVTGKPKLTLTGHERDITAAAFSPDGTKLATGSADGTVKLWDLATGHTSATLTVWRVKKISRYRIFSRMMHEPVVVYVKFSPDQQTVLTNTYWEDSSAKLWDVKDGRLQAELRGPMVMVDYETRPAGVTETSFSPDGKFIATQSADTVRLWKTATGRLIEEFTIFSGAPDFSPDSRWLGLIRIGKQVGLLNLETLKLLPIPGVDTNFVNQQAFSPDSRTFVIAGSYKHYRATLVDVSTGRTTATIPLVSKWGFDFVSEYQKDLDLLSFDPGNRFLMGVNNNSVKLWDVSTGALMWETKEGRDSAAFSRDGKLLATVGKDKKTVMLWEVSNYN